jgi:hypothetical protein
LRMICDWRSEIWESVLGRLVVSRLGNGRLVVGRSGNRRSVIGGLAKGGKGLGELETEARWWKREEGR